MTRYDVAIAILVGLALWGLIALTIIVLGPALDVVDAL